MGMALGALGAIPLVGDAAKKLPEEIIKFFHGGSYSGGVIDKQKAREVGLEVFTRLKTKNQRIILHRQDFMMRRMET